MDATNEAMPPNKIATWVGRLLSAAPLALLLLSGTMKLVQPPEVVEGFGKLGYPQHVAFPLGIVEIACAVLYAMPQTAVLGAILLTGYLGGATATHLRVEEPFYAPILLGVVLWLGLFLRDARVRALVPWRR